MGVAVGVGRRNSNPKPVTAIMSFLPMEDPKVLVNQFIAPSAYLKTKIQIIEILNKGSDSIVNRIYVSTNLLRHH